LNVKKIYLFLLVCAAIAIQHEAFAQTKRVIQLSGIVTDTAGVFVPGANIYVPKAGRGTTSLNNGFFSLPVLIGDSIVISCVGYQRQSYIIASNSKEFTTLLIELHEDNTELPQLIVTMPTLEMFEKAVLALNVPLDDTGIDKKQLNSELLALMVRTTPMDANANYKYYIDQFSNSAENKFHPIYNPFLNPINWVKFIKSLKKQKQANQNRN
jgi:hypothetical protein